MSYALTTKQGVIFIGDTRAECAVIAFERNLVYTHGRKRNSLLPNVHIREATEVECSEYFSKFLDSSS